MIMAIIIVRVVKSVPVVRTEMSVVCFQQRKWSNQSEKLSYKPVLLLLQRCKSSLVCVKSLVRLSLLSSDMVDVLSGYLLMVVD